AFLFVAIVFFGGIKYGEFLTASGSSAVLFNASGLDGAENGPSGKEIKVHIKGAVNNPGVYTLPPGSRVNDVVVMAGPLEEADLDSINLARPLKDGEAFYVPFLGEGFNSGKVNINKASQAELETLRGIGAAKAGAIINYRSEHGPFMKIEDIQKVSGIGPATFEGIKDSICVD
ncbi:MAG: helix-hairpin-helix domain-containing protein, partial [Clostridiales bacterium]|nr:helix-hairpin-helix domain-containing protein [Clostridiales bacterium]